MLFLAISTILAQRRKCLESSGFLGRVSGKKKSLRIPILKRFPGQGRILLSQQEEVKNP
jgi:hypothetical protein